MFVNLLIVHDQIDDEISSMKSKGIGKSKTTKSPSGSQSKAVKSKAFVDDSDAEV